MHSFPKSNKLNPTLFFKSNELKRTSFEFSVLESGKGCWIRLLDLRKEC